MKNKIRSLTIDTSYGELYVSIKKREDGKYDFRVDSVGATLSKKDLDDIMSMIRECILRG